MSKADRGYGCGLNLNIAVFSIAKRLVFVQEGKKMRLRFFQRLESGHDFQHIGNYQETAKLLAGPRNRNATPSFMELTRRIKNNPERCCAYETSEAEIKDHVDDVIIRCDGNPFLDFLCDFRIDILIWSKKEYAVSGVGINAHSEYQSTKLYCNC